MEARLRKAHWEQVYRDKSPDRVSWYQPEAAVSMQLIQRHAPPPAAVLDVGAGASVLVDNLLAAGYAGPTVLDISQQALAVSRARLGARAAMVRWIEDDVTTAGLPDAAFDVWHDRAVFHFLIDAAARRAYVERLQGALRPGGVVVLATFAADGPERCSGLPACRYDAAQLARELGSGFTLIDACTEDHHTPAGSLQRFQYAVFRH